MTAVCRTPLGPGGTVFVAGEHWDAVTESGETVPAGNRVVVVAVDHLTLTVRPSRD